MRAVIFFVPSLLLALPFAACGNSPSSSAGGDAGTDATSRTDAVDANSSDLGFVPDTAPATHCTSGDADPVGLCQQQMVLQNLHSYAFTAAQGVAASWNSATFAPDLNEAGAVTYTLDDLVAYAAAASEYLASAEWYGDTTLNAMLKGDMEAIALQLETSFSVPPTEYSGELYFHLRTFAAGLRELGLTPDGTKLDRLAEAYGRSITAHYFTLGMTSPGGTDAGATDGGPAMDGGSDGGADAMLPADGGVDGAADATLAADGGSGDGGHDATVTDGGSSGDAHADAAGGDASAGSVDGVLGNQAGDQVTYAPGDVAMATTALLDLVARNATDPLVPTWLSVARASLAHLQARAIEPTTGMFYASLAATKGGGPDTVLPPVEAAVPRGALLADTQATFVLAMERAQAIVTASTVVSLTGLDAAGGAVADAGVSGPLVPFLDVPLGAWADETMKAMNGAHAPSLWDGTPLGAGQGYMDGVVPAVDAGSAGDGAADAATWTLLTTKSTRPNALLAEAINVAFNTNQDATLIAQLPSILPLLVREETTAATLHTSFLTVLESQQAYLRGASAGFAPLDAGPHPTSYTASAVSAALDGLNQQLPAQTP